MAFWNKTELPHYLLQKHMNGKDLAPQEKTIAQQLRNLRGVERSTFEDLARMIYYEMDHVVFMYGWIELLNSFLIYSHYNNGLEFIRASSGTAAVYKGRERSFFTVYFKIAEVPRAEIMLARRDQSWRGLKGPEIANGIGSDFVRIVHQSTFYSMVQRNSK